MREQNHNHQSAEQTKQNQTILLNYSSHLQLMKTITQTSKAYQKISKAYTQIKTQILTLAQPLHPPHFPNILHQPTLSLFHLLLHTNTSIADHCKEFSHELHNLHTMYHELVKEKYQEYREEKDNLRHYTEKLGGLSRSVQSERYQRNREKLRNAESGYRRRTREFGKLLVSTNEEVEKIWEKNCVNCITTFLTKYTETLKQTRETLTSIPSTDSEQLILDEQQLDIYLSPASSFKESPKLENIKEEIQRLLIRNRVAVTLAVGMPICEVFGAEGDRKGNGSRENAKGISSEVEKLFGVNSVKLDPQTIPGNKLTQSYDLGLVRQAKPHNNFDFFQNIFSQTLNQPQPQKPQPQPQLLSLNPEPPTKPTTNPFTKSPSSTKPPPKSIPEYSLLDL